MEGTNNKNSDLQFAFDYKALLQTLKDRRKVFYWVIPVTFILSAAFILCIPRYYTCEVVLAPELQNEGTSGSLQALASSFGVDMRSMANSDAIYPMIYPEVVSSHDFLIRLFDVPVTTADNTFSGTYYEYLSTRYKRPFWKKWKAKIISWIPKRQESMPKLSANGNGQNHAFCLNKKQWQIIELMRENIVCTVDRRTDLITFKVKAQDKLVCATMGDSVCSAMQLFMTEYRTKKTHNDIAYYERVMTEAYKEYQEASERYISYVDGHTGMNQEKYRLIAQNLESEKDIKQSAYTSYQKQYMAAGARLQERMPVFTNIQSATVPVKPAGPRRMIFVLGMIFLATLITCFALGKDQLKTIFI